MIREDDAGPTPDSGNFSADSHRSASDVSSQPDNQNRDYFPMVMLHAYPDNSSPTVDSRENDSFSADLHRSTSDVSSQPDNQNCDYFPMVMLHADPNNGNSAVDNRENGSPNTDPTRSTRGVTSQPDRAFNYSEARASLRSNSDSGETIYYGGSVSDGSDDCSIVDSRDSEKDVEKTSDRYYFVEDEGGSREQEMW